MLELQVMCFLSNFTPKSPATVTDDHRTDSSRSTPLAHPQPARERTQRPPSNLSRTQQRASPLQQTLCDSQNFRARHVPKPATFHTHTDHTLLLTPTDLPASAEELTRFGGGTSTEELKSHKKT